ncbi:MAG TPA: SUMF1/EgtB/PvdO family nonheme iron enzyme [Vicinamibacterales bacterium]|jgi:ergothioneine biosynthesis protein EgtB|nr:SUMF1/EgtB/PvdO family nonheme iron enzyme [Vicinamibacterales bacterium]
MANQHTAPLDRSAIVERYRRNRQRSRAIFDLLADTAYYSQPIALRHPIVFYEGHLPGFSFNTLVKKALGYPSIDARLEALFARGIDPHEVASNQPSASARSSGAASYGGAWPSRETVRAFTDEADRRVVDALQGADLDQPGHPLLDRAEAVFAILEHEEMHQETLLYMWHRLPFDQKTRPAPADEDRPHAAGAAPRQEWMQVPAGCATLGIARESATFGWDNEFPAFSVQVPAFRIERHDVTNDRFLEFVEAGGYRDPSWWDPEDWRWIQSEGVAHPLFWERDGGAWYWRGMFARVALPQSWPVYVSHAEASAFARWRGARLPTEAEFQRAAYGSSDGERRHPWGADEPDPAHGVFDFASWDPQPAGSHPKGSSAWGVEDLVGNGWEWTTTRFAPFPGFHAMPSYPEYSSDFFDGEHYVMKGASPATARELVRPTFRNWFRARYPYVYATFRCVRDAAGRP